MALSLKKKAKVAEGRGLAKIKRRTDVSVRLFAYSDPLLYYQERAG